MAQPQIDESARQYRSRHGIVILLARSSQLPPCGVFCFPYRTSLPPFSHSMHPLQHGAYTPFVLCSSPAPPRRHTHPLTVASRRIEIESPHRLLSVILLPSHTDLVIRSRDEPQAYSPLTLVLLRPPLHFTSHPRRFLAMIKEPTLAVVSSAALFHRILSVSSRALPKKTYCGRCPHSFHKRLKLARLLSSARRPMFDALGPTHST